jgi:hypothetical protein
MRGHHFDAVDWRTPIGVFAHHSPHAIHHGPHMFHAHFRGVANCGFERFPQLSWSGVSLSPAFKPANLASNSA